MTPTSEILEKRDHGGLIKMKEYGHEAFVDHWNVGAQIQSPPRRAQPVKNNGRSHTHPPDVTIAISFDWKAESRQLKPTSQCCSFKEGEERGMFS